jgi:hypothetical protein
MMLLHAVYNMYKIIEQCFPCQSHVINFLVLK